MTDFAKHLARHALREVAIEPTETSTGTVAEWCSHCTCGLPSMLSSSRERAIDRWAEHVIEAWEEPGIPSRTTGASDGVVRWECDCGASSTHHCKNLKENFK